MKPKEKALELVDSFINLYEGINLGIAKKHWAKQSALIAVEEILSDYKNYLMHENTEYKGLMYWQEVKKEIEAL
jgi:hypothetical protein